MSTSMADFKLTSAVVIGIVYVQVNETDNLYTMYLTKMMGRVFQPKSAQGCFYTAKIIRFFLISKSF